MRLPATLALLTLAAAASAQELAGAQLARIKDATVYVKHVGFRGLEMGSGYLFRRDGRVGWVLTCEHVVRETNTPTVVFRSGRTGEASFEGRVLATDRERDLACLRVVGEGLPAAIELSARTEVKETETVYVAGFPFGQNLATAGDNPAPSVTRISVSSVRRDEAGEAVVVQLSGDVNPGNSGGPVLDARGRLVGIATSRIQGTEMVFSVPPEGLRAFVRGRLLPVAATAAPGGAGKATLSVRAGVYDPLGRLQSSGCAWVRREALAAAPAPDAEGKWKPVSATMKDIPLKADEETGECSGTAELSRAAASAEIVVQPWWVGADGVKVWGEAVVVKVSFGE